MERVQLQQTTPKARAMSTEADLSRAIASPPMTSLEFASAFVVLLAVYIVLGVLFS